MSEPAPAARLTRHETPGLGERLREQRLERGLSLRELARRLEVSPSLVSQIETGKVQPSVRTLYAIAGELGISLDDVFPSGTGAARVSRRPRRAAAVRAVAEGDADEGGIVQRGALRKLVELETGVRWERLTTFNDREAEFLHTVYPPGSESCPAAALIRHSGREFGLVLSGTLRVTVGFETHVLEAGDSVFFESTIPHRLANDAHEEATAVWAVLGRHAA